MRTGHLFAGIDGLGLGMEPHGFQPAWFSEYEQAPSRVLAHHYPDVPNHGDITTVDWTQVEPVDVLTGGFPCQDISKAGKGAGIKEGTRSGLWFEYVRAIRDLRPRLVIIENVSALAVRGGDIVLGDLAACGFDAWWTTLRASDVGAAHRRERFFIVAHAADGDVFGHLHGEPGVHTAEAGIDAFRDAPAGRDKDAADTTRTEWRGPQQQTVAATFGGAPELRERAGAAAWGGFWPAIRRWEDVIGRWAPAPVADGWMTAEFVEWHMGFPAGWTEMLSRNERLKALGNAVVPQCADVIGRWALQLVDREQAA
jgi:DNA (cytosine-5)-methyltransferase 1